MFKGSSLFSGLLVFGICVPVALFLGYLLATPSEATSMVWIALALFLLLLPLMLKWHHEALIISWNLALVAFFLPGSPPVGNLVVGLSLFFSRTKRTLLRRADAIHCPSVSVPSILLAAIVLITTQQTCAIPAHALP